MLLLFCQKVKSMKIVTKLLATALVFSGFAQGVNAQEEVHKCGADQMRRELIAKDPTILDREAALEEFTKKYIQEHKDAYHQQNMGSRGDLSDNKYVIPIVFHIIHRGGVENINDEQVINQVAILNRDFNKQNADTSEVIPEFQGLIGDAGITFCLPTKDPNGQPTNGIQHYYSSQTYQGQSNYAKMNPWPRDKYLNVWVVNKMQGGVAGYAYYPGSVDQQPVNPTMDGVMILHNYIGNIGTGSENGSRALTHEIGHWLNLKHVWGDNNDPGQACGDDDVDDTPETKGWNFCPSRTSLTQSAVCNPPIRENFQNFMEYSYCSVMFTEGQVLRMHAALESNLSGRNNLWTQENLIATGACLDFTSVPTPDFSPNRLYACIGDEVTFKDNSWNGFVESVTWNPGDNGEFVAGYSENDTLVKMKFNTPGWANVTLTATNANGSNTATKALVYVYDQSVVFPTPYYEPFEQDYLYNDYWASINIDRDVPQFQLKPGVGRNSNQCVLLNNYLSHYEQNIDELVSPAYDCSALTNENAWLSFYYSLASWNPNFSLPFYDSLVVYASKNCGQTWSMIYRDGTNGVVNAGYQPSYYTPGNDASFWKKVRVAIPGPSSNNNMRVNGVRFKVTVWGAHDTNNFYLDDWNIGDVSTGIDDADLSSNLEVYPNPFSSLVNISGLEDKAHSFSVTDITGRQVFHAENLNPANGQVVLDLSSISTTGIYFIKVSDGKNTGNLKLVKN
jgi:hypothetical protein